MNVLWIMVDQLRWDYLSCAGHPHLHTPNIDALAEEGVRFTLGLPELLRSKTYQHPKY